MQSESSKNTWGTVARNVTTWLRCGVRAPRNRQKMQVCIAKTPASLEMHDPKGNPAPPQHSSTQKKVGSSLTPYSKSKPGPPMRWVQEIQPTQFIGREGAETWWW